MQVSDLQLITFKNCKCIHAIFGVIFLLVTGIPAVYCVRCGQSSSKSFSKDDEILTRNEAFCGHGLGRNGVCKRQVTLYLQFYGSES